MSVAWANAVALDFDSEFWGRRMVEVQNVFGIEEAERDGVEFMQARVHPANTGTITDLSSQGFRFADIRVTLDRPSVASESYHPVRFYEETDLPHLVKIARESHRITRYYADSGFPDDRCDDLYETWIRNSVNGWADRVLVAGVPAHGYVTVHLDGDAASIGLIAVAEEARGQGAGYRLVHGALRWAHAAGATRMTVVTQGRNIAAQRLFQRCGFRTSNTEVWLHRWMR